MSRRILCQIFHNSCVTPLRSISSVTTSITKIRRATYSRTYPTMLVFPNGSTVEIRYPEPRAIIKLPVNLSTLSDDERRWYLEKRKPKEKVKIVEEKLVNYDPTKYVKKTRKK